MEYTIRIQGKKQDIDQFLSSLNVKSGRFLKSLMNCQQFTKYF